ncbi:MAG: stage II sporulation protein M [Firmicutes bacterium]|nr:stage II sporulation protein M [Bacillota bacterium]
MQVLKPRLLLARQREIFIPSLFVGGAFLCGLISGALVLHGLTPVQRGDLQQYLNAFLQQAGSLSQGRTVSGGLQAWQEIFKTQLLAFVLLWFSGLTVLGVPLIVFIIGARGFVLGFTVGFLVQEKAWQGLILALVAVLPQNLCYVPAFLGAGLLAFYFSCSLFQSCREYTLFPSILIYSLVFLLIFLLVLLGTWLEAYLVPRAVRLTIFLM